MAIALWIFNCFVIPFEMPFWGQLKEQCRNAQPVEKETAKHSSILAWEILWTEEPGGLQSWGPKSQT